jgi:hypothetical protein
LERPLFLSEKHPLLQAYHSELPLPLMAGEEEAGLLAKLIPLPVQQVPDQ